MAALALQRRILLTTVLLSCLSKSLPIRTLPSFFSRELKVSLLDIIIVFGQSNLNKLLFYNGKISICLRYSSTTHSPVSSFARMPILLTSFWGLFRSYLYFNLSQTISSTIMKCAPSFMSGFKTAFCHFVALATSNRYWPFGSSMSMSSFVMEPGACL